MANGTFRYYRKVDGTWQLSNDEYAKYFVDGNLLCTCWKNAGAGNEEHREWWEIENIENGVMKWKVSHQRETAPPTPPPSRWSKCNKKEHFLFCPH